jgi:hypothetical protein
MRLVSIQDARNVSRMALNFDKVLHFFFIPQPTGSCPRTSMKMFRFRDIEDCSETCAHSSYVSLFATWENVTVLESFPCTTYHSFMSPLLYHVVHLTTGLHHTAVPLHILSIATFSTTSVQSFNSSCVCAVSTSRHFPVQYSILYY